MWLHGEEMKIARKIERDKEHKSAEYPSDIESDLIESFILHES